MASAAISKWKNKYDAMKNRTARIREKAGETVQAAVETAETGASAFALGVAQGRFGSKAMEIGGVHAALGVGLGAHVLAFMGVKGAESHFRAIGNGALAAYATVQGLKIGMAQEFQGKKGVAVDQVLAGDDSVMRLLNPEGARVSGGESYSEVLEEAGY